jgi:hypothetical protein
MPVPSAPLLDHLIESKSRLSVEPVDERLANEFFRLGLQP